ncbi:BCCT family transporter [Pseudoramibacter faecis]|uniref:BCCT family transporter n=1 Tax=Pseudoramibacter faecis TaxID=3108534 RepID=UPI002E78E4EA|nr:BCCT family transporter [Pseudoramibacter sp. HA2172]
MNQHEKQNAPVTTGVWEMINKKIFVPGVIILIIFVASGILFPKSFLNVLNVIEGWEMGSAKWIYVLCAVLTSMICLWVLISSKYGNIKFGGKNAQSTIKKRTWITISLTGSIAIGICFFGVAGPVQFFLDPPKFLGVQGGTQAAVVPSIMYSFLHYGLPPYFIVTFAGFAIALMTYNGKRAFRASSTLYPLIGDKCDGIIGNVVDIIMFLSLVIVGTNMGLSVIQLNAGIGNILGNPKLDIQLIIILVYVVATVFFATSGVHGAMGKLSDTNALLYVFVILFALLVGPTNRLICLGFEAVSRFVMNYIPMVGFGDAVMQTGWQNSNTMFYYSWNAMPGLLAAFFYATMAYGRTLREFIVVNCLVPCAFLVCWYVFVGGSAIFGVMNGSNLPEVIAQYGSGIATFAFLDTLPFGAITKWVFIVMAVMTFVTWSDAIAFSFPMMFLKETTEDKAENKTPKILIAGTGIFMGLLTFVLVYVGGYDAMNTSIVCWGLPASLLLCLMVISCFKFLLHRENYDYTYIEENAEATAMAEAKPTAGSPEPELDPEPALAEAVAAESGQ